MAAVGAANYYDIILVGKTGQGKSTLGNKLLNISKTKHDLHPSKDINPERQDGSKRKSVHRKYFTTADDLVDDSKKMLSVTEKCKLLKNEEIKLRVLDTPGLASSEVQPGVTVFESNLQIFRWIVREQADPSVRMSAHRLLYFLPARGVLRKADGDLQEELKVMYHFFGRAVFNNMVIIATQDIKYQRVDFTNEDCCRIRDVFCKAVCKATKIEMTPATCPPVLYIGYHDTHDEVLQAVKHANVSADSAFIPQFLDDICSRCSAKTRYKEAEGKFEPIGVIIDNTFEKYEESKCHPEFVQKYSTATKVKGGFGHIAVLGTALMYEAVTGKDTWPGFTNSDEICPYCKQAPGSKGCCTVLTNCNIPGTDKSVIVDHRNDL